MSVSKFLAALPRQKYMKYPRSHFCRFSLEYVCRLHCNESKGDDLGDTIPFNKDSLERCKIVLQIRIEAKLKYSEFKLPNQINSKDGYHIQCYRKFVALPQKHRDKLKDVTQNSQVENEEESKKISTLTTRSKVMSPKPSSSTGVFPSICLFCNKSRKKVHGVEQKLVQVETKIVEENIRKYAALKKDDNLIARITSIDFLTKEIKYHNCCRLKYQKEAEAVATSIERSTYIDIEKKYLA